MISDEKKSRKKYFFLLVFGCLTLIVVFYHLPFAKPVLQVPKSFGKFHSEFHRLQKRKPGDVELFRPHVYHIYPVMEMDGKGDIFWQMNLFEPLRKKYGWNAAQLRALLDLLVRDLTNQSVAGSGDANAYTSDRMEKQLHRCEIDPDTLLLKLCDPIFLGSFPENLLNNIPLNRTFEENNPMFNLSSMYWQHKPEVNSTQLIECSKTSEKRRKLLHDALQHWIKFAGEQRIWWSIAYGSLIESLRDGNIIPYDTDMDIFVLGSDEEKIRRLATVRTNITVGKMNMVTRPGQYCSVNPGQRMDCKGNQVESLLDTCSFCGPLARIFMDYGNYIDLYPINIELRTNNQGLPSAFGYTLEGGNEPFVYNMTSLLPLQRCQMMGLQVPCPHHPDTLLEKLYNKNWKTPYYRCNGTTGKWESV